MKKLELKNVKITKLSKNEQKDINGGIAPGHSLLKILINDWE